MSTPYADLAETPMSTEPPAAESHEHQTTDVAAAVGTDAGMDSQTAQSLAIELAAVTRAMFGLAATPQALPSDQLPTEAAPPGIEHDVVQPPVGVPVAPPPVAVDVPAMPAAREGDPAPQAGVPVPGTAPAPPGIPVPEAPSAPQPPPAEEETTTAPPPTAVPVPGSIPVPAAAAPGGSKDRGEEPRQGRPEEGQERRRRPGRRSMELLQEIAFLDE